MYWKNRKRDVTFPVEPLLFTPRTIATIWGGQTLRQQYSKQTNGDIIIGESWEISGIPGLETAVARGPFMQQQLTAIIRNYPTELIGRRFADAAAFPLLIKFIDAKEPLSIQVHPDDRQARLRYNEPSGKTECWYIAKAGPDAHLCIGLRDRLTRNELQAAISGGELEKHLNIFPVHEGEFYFIPGGTIHAILGDIVLYEVQQSSTTTFRMYDWQRRDASGNTRTLHVEDAVAVADLSVGKQYHTQPILLSENEAINRSLGIACANFAVESIMWKRESVFELPSPSDSCRIISLMEGNLHLFWKNGHLTLQKGSTVLLPASLRDYSLQGTKGTVCLSTYIPDLENDIYLPLTRMGISADSIEALGLTLSAPRSETVL